MKDIAAALKRAAERLRPHQAAVLEAWTAALSRLHPGPAPDLRAFCTKTLNGMLDRLERGEAEAWLLVEAEAAHVAARAGESFAPLALAISTLDRCCLPHLLASCPDQQSLAESLRALDELADRRLEVLLRAQEDESARRLLEAQEQAAQASGLLSEKC